MVSSDDIASLKVEVQKLAVALDRFAQKLAVKGNVHGSKLPSISQESNTTIGAHKVFVKIPEPNIFSNPSIQTSIGTKSIIPEDGYANGLVPKAQSKSAHKVLDQLPIPTFILEMAKVAKITHENEEIADGHQVFDNIPEPTKQANTCQIACQAVVITNEDASVNNDHFTHNQQLSETLDALNGSYLHDMVIIDTNRKHTLISPNCAAFDQTPNKYGDFYNGNSYYLEYPYLQVTIKPSPSFVEIGSHVLYKDAMNIYYDDLVWNMLSEPIYFYRFVFDPGVLLKWVSNFENFPLSKLVEFKMEVRGYLHCKEVYSWEKLEVILGVLIGLDSLLNTFQPPSFRNFDNFLLYSAIHNHAHTRTLNSCGNSSENADLMIVHSMDLRPGVLNTPTIYLFHEIELLSYNITRPVLSYDLCDYDMSTSRMTDQYILFGPGIRVHDASVSIFTYILEDKDDFTGEEDTTTGCHWELCNSHTLESHFNASKTIMSPYVFHPSGLSWPCESWDDHLYKLLPLSVPGSTPIWLVLLVSLFLRFVTKFLLVTPTLTLDNSGE